MYSDDNTYRKACPMCRTAYTPLKDLKLVKEKKDCENAVDDLLRNQNSDREEMTATINKLKADLEERDQLIICKDIELKEKMEEMRQRGIELMKTEEENKKMEKVMREKANLEKKRTRKVVTDENFVVLIKLVKRQKTIIEKLSKKKGEKHY